MQSNKLLRTNILVSIILVIGFTLIAIFSYKANYKDSLDNLERVSSLTAEGIYYQITAMFTRPVNTSQTMAHDSFLVEHLLNEPQEADNMEYIWTTQTYLNAYRIKYGFDSVFLVSAATGRYYNFNGLDRVLKEEDQENTWYFDFLNGNEDYNLNVDNDEVEGAENEITVFINCKVTDNSGTVIGVVGVGIRLGQLRALLAEYEEKYFLEACLVSSEGKIEISTTYNGYDSKDWFEVNGQQKIRKQVMDWKDDCANLEMWNASNSQNNDKNYIVARYIPELSWHLLVKQNTGEIIRKIRIQVTLTIIGIVVVILIVLAVITNVIKRFNSQITKLLEERQTVFRKSTEQLYDNIYEFNITKNNYVGEREEQYFASLGAKGMTYDQCLRVIAEKQIKEEFREGYLSTLSANNVIREYENGNTHLRYDFMITTDGEEYHWMRIDANIFFSTEDQSIHMFTYRKNIDAEKSKEIQAEMDEMTGFFTKKATERMIQKELQENKEQLYAFFILDIDNFKTANDQFGHAFGDICIKEFTGIIREHFTKDDILGRVGGDEFVAFASVSNREWAQTKAKELLKALDITCTNQLAAWKMSASIGVAVASAGGTDFDSLYRHADQALYQVKQKGKNGYYIYSSRM